MANLVIVFFRVLRTSERSLSLAVSCGIRVGDSAMRKEQVGGDWVFSRVAVRYSDYEETFQNHVWWASCIVPPQADCGIT